MAAEPAVEAAPAPVDAAAPPVEQAESAPGTMEAPADGGGADDAGEASPGSVDLDALRRSLAGDDEGFLKQLNRYRSADAIGKAFRDAKLAAQQKQKPLSLADGASEDDIAAYREAVGIPEDAKDYPVSFSEDYEPSEVDGEFLGSFKSRLHEANIDPRAGKVAMEWYEDTAREMRQAMDLAMAKQSKETQTILRGEYGAEFDGNMMAANELLKTHMGEEGRDEMLSMRLMDGTRLQDHPGFVRMMVQLGTDYYGSNAIMTGDVESTAKTVDEKIEDLKGLMSTDPAKYYSAPIQEEMAKLIDQRARLQERNKR